MSGEFLCTEYQPQTHLHQLCQVSSFAQSINLKPTSINYVRWVPLHRVSFSNPPPSTTVCQVSSFAQSIYQPQTPLHQPCQVSSFAQSINLTLTPTSINPVRLVFYNLAQHGQFPFFSLTNHSTLLYYVYYSVVIASRLVCSWSPRAGCRGWWCPSTWASPSTTPTSGSGAS